MPLSASSVTDAFTVFNATAGVVMPLGLLGTTDIDALCARYGFSFFCMPLASATLAANVLICATLILTRLPNSSISLPTDGEKKSKLIDAKNNAHHGPCGSSSNGRYEALPVIEGVAMPERNGLKAVNEAGVAALLEELALRLAFNALVLEISEDTFAIYR